MKWFILGMNNLCIEWEWYKEHKWKIIKTIDTLMERTGTLIFRVCICMEGHHMDFHGFACVYCICGKYALANSDSFLRSCPKSTDKVKYNKWISFELVTCNMNTGSLKSEFHYCLGLGISVTSVVLPAADDNLLNRSPIHLFM